MTSVKWILFDTMWHAIKLGYKLPNIYTAGVSRDWAHNDWTQNEVYFMSGIFYSVTHQSLFWFCSASISGLYAEVAVRKRELSEKLNRLEATNGMRNELLSQWRDVALAAELEVGVPKQETWRGGWGIHMDAASNSTLSHLQSNKKPYVTFSNYLSIACRLYSQCAEQVTNWRNK